MGTWETEVEQHNEEDYGVIMRKQKILIVLHVYTYNIQIIITPKKLTSSWKSYNFMYRVATIDSTDGLLLLLL